MKQSLAIFLLALLIAACQPERTAPPPQGTPVSRDTLTSLNQQAQPTAVADAVISAADAEYLLLTNVYERVAPSVVNIEVTLAAPVDDFHQGLDSSAEGSGFIYDSDGHIVTNAHVVRDAQSVLVTFNDGFVADARVVGIDLFSDVAVIRVDTDATRLLPVTFGDSDALRVGQRAIAIGNPFGLASSMTVGIVSGLGRQLPSADLIGADGPQGFNNPSIIQVDTDINPGNSGGPLLNSRGEVIGINTAIRTDTGTFQGVGFAVPSRTVQRVVPELIRDGSMDYAWLGITSLPAEDGFSVAALAEPLNLPVTNGVLIEAVMPDSPANRAGLLGGNREREVRGTTVCAGGDIIVAVNGTYIRNMDELLYYIVLNTAPGDTVNLLVVRGDQTFELPLTLEARPTGDTGSVPPCQ